MESKTEPLPDLTSLLERLPPPNNLFAGLKIGESLAPNNILLFQRSGKQGMKGHGVSSNYYHGYRLISALQRAGSVRVDQTSYRLEPGECALVFPNQFYHCMEPEGCPKEWLYMTFDIKEGGAISNLRNSPRQLGTAGMAALEHLLKVYLSSEAPDALVVSYELARLLRHLSQAPKIGASRCDIHSSDGTRDTLLDGINTYVRANLNQSLTIPELAKKLGYSVSHLRSVFRDRLRVSLGKYMREMRLAEAARLLQSSELKVSDISSNCGFESLYAFSRAFRKTYAVAPRDYRALVKAGD